MHHFIAHASVYNRTLHVIIPQCHTFHTLCPTLSKLTFLVIQLSLLLHNFVCDISGAHCIVVTSKDLRKNGDIWVCPNTDHVCTRFFFVYDDMANAVNFDTRQSQCKREINHAVEHIRNFKKRAK